MRELLHCNSSQNAQDIVCFLRTVLLNSRDKECQQFRKALLKDFDVVDILCKSLAVIYTEENNPNNGYEYTQSCAEILLSMLSPQDYQSTQHLLQQFVHECGNYVIANQEVKLREIFAQFFSVICSRITSNYLLPYFLHFFALALRGVGDFNSTIRQQCTIAFRQLVPLAPLAKQQLLSLSRQDDIINDDDPSIRMSPNDKNSLGNTMFLLRQIFQREKINSINQSTNSEDVQIVNILLGIMSPTESSQNERSAYTLRQYQWEGISWLTNLRRCGLSGILADEMGLGKRF